MKYLAAVDLSDASLLTLDALRALAGEEPGDVALLHVIDLDLYTAGGMVPSIMEFARERLTQESTRLTGCGLNTPTIRVEQGDSTQTILRVAAEESADLIVMTNLGKGARTGRLFGSTAERVASAGTVPVLIERVTADEGDGGSCCRVVESSPFARVFVAVDLEHRPVPILRFVLSLPNVEAVRVVHVVRDAAEVDTASETLRRMLAEFGNVESMVLSGPPAATIVREAAAWGATSIALAPMAHTIIHRALWGSVARDVAHNAESSVLFVPATER